MSWGLFAVAAALSYFVPFTGDQYFFAIGARELANGARLYIDFWDVKQPGIYWIYLAAGVLPLELTQAVRLIEIGCWVGVGILATRIVYLATQSKRIALATPALVGGSILLAAPASHLSQVESFAILPIMFIVEQLCRGTLSRLRWLSIGAALAVLAFLKLLLVPIPGMLVLVAWLMELRPNVALARRCAAGAALMMSLGAGLVLILGSVPLVLSGSYAEFLYVSLQYPLTVLHGDDAAPLSRLLHSAAWCMGTALPLALFAPFVLFRRVGASDRSLRAASLLMGWIVIASIVILLQRNSWWAYHMTLLKPPLLMLGLIGLAALDTVTPRLADAMSVRRAGGFVMLVFVVAAVPSLSQVLPRLDVGFVVTNDRVDRDRYENALAPGYIEVRSQGRQARTSNAKQLCVIGDPALLYAAELRCTTSVYTWSGGALSDYMWRRMATEYQRTRPELVYVAASDRVRVEAHAPQLLRWLEANYDFVGLGQGIDRWYRERPTRVAKP